MKKNPSPLEDLDIIIEENNFESIKNNCLYLEHLYPGKFSIVKNILTKCHSIAVKLFGCRAVKDDILFSENDISSVYNVAICIDGSIIRCIKNTISSCQGGLILQLYVISNTLNREEVFDSHKDIILRDSIKDRKDSVMGGTGSAPSHGMVNMSLLGIGTGTGIGTVSGTDSGSMANCSRVIFKDNVLKEIAHYGVLITCNSSCSVKVENCRFRNVKEPVVINERDVNMSRNNSKNYIQPDNSELLAPTYNATPRQIVHSNGKGTIVIKNNSAEGSESCVVRKHLSSHLYDINNNHQITRHPF